jgi:hypothetical protein
MVIYVLFVVCLLSCKQVLMPWDLLFSLLFVFSMGQEEGEQQAAGVNKPLTEQNSLIDGLLHGEYAILMHVISE